MNEYEPATYLLCNEKNVIHDYEQIGVHLERGSNFSSSGLLVVLLSSLRILVFKLFFTISNTLKYLNTYSEQVCLKSILNKTVTIMGININAHT